MKEATGELSLTVVVIIAIIAVIAIVRLFFIGDDAIAKKWIEGQWGSMTENANQGELSR